MCETGTHALRGPRVHALWQACPLACVVAGLHKHHSAEALYHSPAPAHRRCSATAPAATGAPASAGARRCLWSWWTRPCCPLRTTVSGVLCLYRATAGQAAATCQAALQCWTCAGTAMQGAPGAAACSPLPRLHRSCLHPFNHRARPAPRRRVRQRRRRHCAAGCARGLVCGAAGLPLLLLVW